MKKDRIKALLRADVHKQLRMKNGKFVHPSGAEIEVNDVYFRVNGEDPVYIVPDNALRAAERLGPPSGHAQTADRGTAPTS